MAADADTRERLEQGLAALPALARLREAAAGTPVYLVGGAVRDILLGRPRADIDVVVEGDAAALAQRLGAQHVTHERFGTAVVELDGLRVDLATARRETYAEPGALPDVEPAALAQDLGRRDFTINAMATPLDGEPELIDPHGGEADLRARLLRVLHDRSFVDDPTRALRAARYAARFGFELEPETERLLRAANLATVSRDRVDAELRRLAAEADPGGGFERVVAWGLIEPSEEVRELAAARPQRPSRAVELARGRSEIELALARASGAEWIDRYLAQWRDVRLEIGGEDLLAAGVPEGPAVGRGLAAALTAKLDGEISGREAELETALAAARADA